MQTTGRILIVDDDKSILQSLKILLEDVFEDVKTISNPNLILSEYQKGCYDIVLLDMNFSSGINSGNEGIFWLNEILKTDKQAVVILITAYGDVDLAVNAMKEGATDFIIKPWNNDKLISTLNSALKIRKSQLEINKLSKEKETLSAEINKPTQKIIGSSTSMSKIFTLIDKVAATDVNVLILGENGTGKELIAKEIHRKSNRQFKPMISIDMGTIAETLFESELFGHKKGAFTDAREDRTGRFEIANGGTLFLDEIGNLSVSLQSKILTALQKREITPIGSNISIPIDVRLITATNKNLEDLIKKGLFREDLYYRINTVQIELPPLRERQEDIAHIADFYLITFKSKYEKPLLKFSNKAIETLLKYSWPGNIRELKHTIEKAVILSTGSSLQPEDFMLKQSTNSTEWPLKFEEIEKQAIIRALKNNSGKMIDASKELGLTRQTLYNKIRKYNL
ncbi:MAG: sigma-54-dependent Fis family transcriptional regulator [Bacteroidetes bacterium GWF2_33_16]|nr:MAG: sigma-54-dependent Fis family transcriptional regulator [Bacteroidetes bacterium GWE2_32_14]OFY06378.1 MAG: sigma-54-dependent Fis family transcriptional regulator [Bacteroidetes bacterium GWF2_33_16]